jgi:hypothetical protein
MIELYNCSVNEHKYINNNLNNELRMLEKKYSKKYPIGSDFFKIVHYPNYSSFFEQFKKYHYLTYNHNNKIIATCCFANLNGALYACDLKSFETGYSTTYHFYKYVFFKFTHIKNIWNSNGTK